MNQHFNKCPMKITYSLDAQGHSYFLPYTMALFNSYYWSKGPDKISTKFLNLNNLNYFFFPDEYCYLQS